MDNLAPIEASLAQVGVAASLPLGPDTTSSRVLVNNAVLRAVAFAMDAGQELTEHRSPRAATVTVEQGVLDFHIGPECHRLGMGDVVYLAPDTPHALQAVEPSRFTVVLVDMHRTQ